MSDNIPLEIQLEIIKRLPVTSLIRFRAVSKSWKSLIDSSRFIKNYSCQMHHLLIRYHDDNASEPICVSFVDDHTFPQQSVSLTLPLLFHTRANPRIIGRSDDIIGCSHGLFCLHGTCFYIDDPSFRRIMAVIWNPAIRKAVGGVVPDEMEDEFEYETLLGFGVCRETNDPKILKITKMKYSMPSRVQVFTLSTRAWRSPHNNLPREFIVFNYSQVAINGVLYWHATDVDVTMDEKNLVVTFDMTSEQFGELNLPDSLAHLYVTCLCLSKLRESLVVLDSDTSTVWMLDDGVSKSFTKLFTLDVNPLYAYAYVAGFRKSGEAIVDILEEGFKIHQLITYEPYSKHMDDVGIDVNTISHYAFCVYPYMETLLLLDQPNLVVYHGN